jgi:very-short-patch-repair endonuclease
MIINEKPSGEKYTRSSLEKAFERIWVWNFPSLDLHVEQKLVPGRQFRCDYAHLPSKTVIEIHGGMFMARGGHSTMSGKASDAEKQNLLVINGYRPFLLWTNQVTPEFVKQIGEFILNDTARQERQDVVIWGKPQP